MSPTPRFPNFEVVNANRYAQEAVRNTLGNEEKNFQQQIRKITEFQQNFRNKLIAANPKILREHRLMRINRRRPSQAYLQFINEATARSNRAVRKQFKNVLPQLDKYQARKEKFIKSIHDKYAATSPRYARILTHQKTRDNAIKQAALKQKQQWEKWAKQNDPNVYKKYLRHKNKFNNQKNVSSSFYNVPNIGYRESQDRWRQSQGQQPTLRWPTLITDNTGIPSIMHGKKRLRATPNSQRQAEALKNAQRDAQFAQFRNQLEYAPNRDETNSHALFDSVQTLTAPKQPKPKVSPITRTTTQPKAKIGTPVQTYTPSKRPKTHGGHPYKIGTQQPTYIKKFGGKVTKTYANGGSVRKPKYNTKG